MNWLDRNEPEPTTQEMVGIAGILLTAGLLALWAIIWPGRSLSRGVWQLAGVEYL